MHQPQPGCRNRSQDFRCIASPLRQRGTLLEWPLLPTEPRGGHSLESTQRDGATRVRRQGTGVAAFHRTNMKPTHETHKSLIRMAHGDASTPALCLTANGTTLRRSSGSTRPGPGIGHMFRRAIERFGAVRQYQKCHVVEMLRLVQYLRVRYRSGGPAPNGSREIGESK
jgi:hypothetical protein